MSEVAIGLAYSALLFNDQGLAAEVNHLEDRLDEMRERLEVWVLRAASGWIRETAKKEQAEGRRVMRKVVNITSISGMDGIAGQAGYGTGKAGIIGLTKVMAKEWGRYNVNVNAVGFGFIETRLTQALGGEIDVQGRKIKVGVQENVREALRAQNPLGRYGTPEEAAGPVLFFCSPQSDYVTGEVLLCSGGSHV